MRIFTVAGTLLLLASPVFAQAPGETIDVGGWKVRRVPGDAGTQTCVAVQTGDDKTGVGFGGTNKNQAFLMLIDGDGKLTPNAHVTLQYRVDKGATAKADAMAVNPTTLIAMLGTLNDVGPFFTAVEAGDNIHLETGDSEYDYTLNNSKEALGALATCIKAAMGS